MQDTTIVCGATKAFNWEAVLTLLINANGDKKSGELRSVPEDQISMGEKRLHGGRIGTKGAWGNLGAISSRVTKKTGRERSDCVREVVVGRL